MELLCSGVGAPVPSPGCPLKVSGMRSPSACFSHPGPLAHRRERCPPRPARQAHRGGPSVFIFPWVQRELLESGSGEAREARMWRTPQPSAAPGGLGFVCSGCEGMAFLSGPLQGRSRPSLPSWPGTLRGSPVPTQVVRQPRLCTPPHPPQ